MREKNYTTLREALDRLPSYEAPPLGSSRLTTEHLPTYAPPPAVWNKVNEGLARRPSVRRLPRRVLLGIAASLLVLVVAAFAMLYDAGPRISYAYEREAAPTPVVADWNEDETSFDRARREIERRDEPSLNSLGHELDELNAAREEIKSMLVAYGEDPIVINQLAEIERERDDVYRRVLVEL